MPHVSVRGAAAEKLSLGADGERIRSGQKRRRTEPERALRLATQSDSSGLEKP
jgi:hypothetical protein